MYTPAQGGHRFLGALGGGGSRGKPPPPPPVEDALDDDELLPRRSKEAWGVEVFKFDLRPGMLMEKVWPSLRL